MRFRSPTALVLLGALGLVHCSGGSFDVANGPGEDTGSSSGDGATDSSIDDGVDSGNLLDSGRDATPLDSGTSGDGTSSDGITVDGTPGETISSCGTLAVDATDIYVDKSATTASVGTMACPFRTIREATVLGSPSTGTRYIHVAGGTPIYDYVETLPIIVAPRVQLLGAGVTKTKITGPNPTPSCWGGYSGAVCIDVLGVIDGFSVTVGAGVGSGSVIVTNGGGSATIKNVTAFGGKDHGLVIGQGAEIGPNVLSTTNTHHGLYTTASGFIHVNNPSSFNYNYEHGIYLNGSMSRLSFDGGYASNNVGVGLRLASSPTTAHTINNLTAQNNGGAGVNCSGASLYIHTSVLTKNKSFGLVFNYGSSGSYSLDIGVTSGGSFGNDTFGGATENNSTAGICLLNSGLTGSQAAANDKFTNCPPTQAAVGGCDGGGGVGYKDVWYSSRIGSTAVDPLLASGCGSGP